MLLFCDKMVPASYFLAMYNVSGIGQQLPQHWSDHGQRRRIYCRDGRAICRLLYNNKHSTGNSQNASGSITLLTPQQPNTEREIFTGGYMFRASLPR